MDDDGCAALLGRLNADVLTDASNAALGEELQTLRGQVIDATRALKRVRGVCDLLTRERGRHCCVDEVEALGRILRARVSALQRFGARQIEVGASVGGGEGNGDQSFETETEDGADDGEMGWEVEEVNGCTRNSDDLERTLEPVGVEPRESSDGDQPQTPTRPREAGPVIETDRAEEVSSAYQSAPVLRVSVPIFECVSETETTTSRESSPERREGSAGTVSVVDEGVQQHGGSEAQPQQSKPQVSTDTASTIISVPTTIDQSAMVVNSAAIQEAKVRPKPRQPTKPRLNKATKEPKISEPRSVSKATRGGERRLHIDLEISKDHRGIDNEREEELILPTAPTITASESEATEQAEISPNLQEPGPPPSGCDKHNSETTTTASAFSGEASEIEKSPPLINAPAVLYHAESILRLLDEIESDSPVWLASLEAVADQAANLVGMVDALHDSQPVDRNGLDLIDQKTAVAVSRLSTLLHASRPVTFGLIRIISRIQEPLRNVKAIPLCLLHAKCFLCPPQIKPILDAIIPAEFLASDVVNDTVTKLLWLGVAFLVSENPSDKMICEWLNMFNTTLLPTHVKAEFQADPYLSDGISFPAQLLILSMIVRCVITVGSPDQNRMLEVAIQNIRIHWKDCDHYFISLICMLIRRRKNPKAPIPTYSISPEIERIRFSIPWYYSTRHQVLLARMQVMVGDISL